MTTTVLIAEDEPLAAEALADWVKATPGLQLVAVCEDGEEALEKIRALKPALVLTDIQMPVLTGLQVVQALQGDAHQPRIIFTTAYDQHALTAFELHAVDYLLKPFSRERFDEAVSHALRDAAPTYAEVAQALGAAPDAPLTRLLVRDQGKIFPLQVADIECLRSDNKYTAITAKGRSFLVRLPIADFEKDELFLVFATAEGRVKRSSLRLYQNVNRSGIIALDLREGDRLIGVVWTTGHDHLLLGTAGGMAIRFKEEDARAMGRDASGVKGIELTDDDRVVGMVKIAMRSSERDDDQQEPELDLLTVTENGYGKRTPLIEYLVASESEGGATTYRAQSRGGKGRIDIRTSERNGRVVTVMAAHESEGVVLTTQQGLLVRVPAGQISRIGRATQGVRVVNLKEGDRLIAAATVPAEESESGTEETEQA